MVENGTPDLLIHNAAVLENGHWLKPAWLGISGDRISALAPGKPPEALRIQCPRVIDAAGMAALPGLTNAHTHLSQTFMRGLSGGRPLLPWLQELIWPLQGAFSVEDMRLAALLGLVENLRCGATQVIDNHKITASMEHTDAVLEAAQQVGLGFTLARAWSDLGKNPEPAQAVLADLERLFAAWNGHPFIRIANGPLALWRCSEQLLQRTHALAVQHGSFTHVHTAESSQEVQLSVDAYRLRPVEWLDRIGVLDTNTQLVHGVWLEEQELDRIAASGAAVVHCPVSNAVLGSGTAPVGAMLSRGIRVLLGTDGPASNDTQDTWETLKFAVSLARIVGLDPTLLPPDQALALALAGRTLQQGAPADLILVNTAHSRVSPVHDLTSALVLGTHGSDVDTVIRGGNILMQHGKILILDEEALLAQCSEAVIKLRKKAGID